MWPVKSNPNIYESIFKFWTRHTNFYKAVKVQRDQAIKEWRCIETLNSAKIDISCWKTWMLIQWAGPIHFAVLLRARVPADDVDQTAPTLVHTAWGCQCITRENAGCKHQSHIRMVMAHCSQHGCKGDDENIPLCTSASVLATAALPLIWIEASQSEYGWRCTMGNIGKVACFLFP